MCAYRENLLKPGSKHQDFSEFSRDRHTPIGKGALRIFYEESRHLKTGETLRRTRQQPVLATECMGAAASTNAKVKGAPYASAEAALAAGRTREEITEYLERLEGQASTEDAALSARPETHNGNSPDPESNNTDDKETSRFSKSISAAQDVEARWKAFQASFDEMMSRFVEKIGESLMAEEKVYAHKIIDFKSCAMQIIKAKNIAVLTGAGISVASGIPTYRGNDGTRTLGSKNYTPQEIATMAMYQQHMEKCWNFWEKRSKICAEAEPNIGHFALAEITRLCKSHGKSFQVITQNIDNLHGRAGNQEVLEIHGNLKFVRCIDSDCSVSLIPIDSVKEKKGGSGAIESNELKIPTCSQCGKPLRPHVLWFDECYREDLYSNEKAMEIVQNCDLLLVIGTTFATSLPRRILHTVAKREISVIDINPIPNTSVKIAPLQQLVLSADKCLPRLQKCLERRFTDKRE